MWGRGRKRERAYLGWMGGWGAEGRVGSRGEGFGEEPAPRTERPVGVGRGGAAWTRALAVHFTFRSLIFPPSDPGQRGVSFLFPCNLLQYLGAREDFVGFCGFRLCDLIAPGLVFIMMCVITPSPSPSLPCSGFPSVRGAPHWPGQGSTCSVARGQEVRHLSPAALDLVWINF